jgi:hypothetical protein
MYDGSLAGYQRPAIRGFWGVGEADPVGQDMLAQLTSLRMEHRDLDAAIEALRATAGYDQIQLARLKKRKLRLKDEIALLEDLSIPDIIA